MFNVSCRGAIDNALTLHVNGLVFDSRRRKQPWEEQIGSNNWEVWKIGCEVALFALACSRLSGSGEDAKVKGTRRDEKEEKEERESLLSPVSSRFIFVFALSQFLRTQLSRSLEQAKFSVRPRTQTYFRSSLPTTGNSLPSQASRNRDSTACKTSDISFSARFADLLKARFRLRASFMNELIH